MPDEPTFKQRFRYTYRETFPGGWFGVGLAVIAFAFAPFIDAGEPWVLPVFGAGVLLLLCIYAMIQHIGGGAIVDAAGIEHTFESLDYFTDSKKLTAWYLDVYEPKRLDVARGHGTMPMAELQGATCDVPDDAPKELHDEDGDGDLERVAAARSFPETKHMDVPGEVLLGDVHIHELDHLLAYQLFGDRDDWSELSGPEQIALVRGGTDG
ncbi:MAG: hypothetical protein ABEN55_12060 [Bradymonadaceae bacterium]